MRIRQSVTSVLAGAALLALAGCSSDTPSSTPSASMSTTTTTTTTEPTNTVLPASDAVVNVATTDLGTILVDESGQVLYTYDPDAGAGASTCTDSCALAWPPLVTGTSATAGAGVDATLLGTTTRDDGTIQVTYDGWPLYLYAADSADGAATGQGSGGVWWVIDATGAQVKN